MLKKCGEYKRSGSKPDLRISMMRIEGEVPPVKVVKVDLPETVRQFESEGRKNSVYRSSRKKNLLDHSSEF